MLAGCSFSHIVSASKDRCMSRRDHEAKRIRSVSDRYARPVVGVSTEGKDPHAWPRAPRTWITMLVYRFQDDSHDMFINYESSTAAETSRNRQSCDVQSLVLKVSSIGN